MLEHQKNILKALQNHELLFLKEVQKSVEWLNEQELDELNVWLSEHYPKIYKTQIAKMMHKIPA